MLWGLKVLIILGFKSEISWTTSVSLCSQCKAAGGLRPEFWNSDKLGRSVARTSAIVKETLQQLC